MAKLTYDMLVAAGACKQREEFKRIAAGGIEVTDETMEQYASHFEVDFSVKNFLKKPYFKEFAREIAKNAKRFNSRNDREFKVFYAVTAGKWFRKQTEDENGFEPKSSDTLPRR